LAEIFRNDREDFEKKWDDINLFIQYGMLSDEKFYDRAIGFALLKNLDSKYFTFEEYKTQVKEAQTDKNGDLIILYAQDADASYAYIQRAKEKGYDVLLMDGELDVHAMSQLEQKSYGDGSDDKKQMLRFVRVDSDVIENIIQKEEILTKVWGYDSEAEDNNVEVYICFLRKKLSFLKSDVTISTARKIGYHLEKGNKS
jgi:molecular chaperone HtpG